MSRVTLLVVCCTLGTVSRADDSLDVYLGKVNAAANKGRFKEAAECFTDEFIVERLASILDDARRAKKLAGVSRDLPIEIIRKLVMERVQQRRAIESVFKNVDLSSLTDSMTDVEYHERALKLMSQFVNKADVLQLCYLQISKFRDIRVEEFLRIPPLDSKLVDSKIYENVAMLHLAKAETSWIVHLVRQSETGEWRIHKSESK